MRVAAVLLVSLGLGLVSCGRQKATPQGPAESVTGPAAAPVDVADVPREASPAGPSRRVLWIGLDGLDWEILDRLSSQGLMPNWTRLVSGGYTSRLTSFVPILSPVIWTTVATGVGPDVHRVLDFQEVDPQTGRKVPISGLSRAVPAVWNLVSAAGRKVGVVGWWASHPAEEVQGFFVTDHASPILYDAPSLSGTAYPQTLEKGISQIAARDGKITEADLRPFLDLPTGEIARALGSGEGMENHVVALARILRATRVSQRIARELYDRDRPELMMLYLEGTDEIGHVFAPMTPPKLPCAADEDVSRYGHAAAAYYGMIDRILGQWMRRASEDHATLIVHSDHGFKWGADRFCDRSSSGWATAASWHRLDGVFAAWGENVVAGKGAEKSTMFDVAPTVLALLGLSQDRRMTGHPIAAGFSGLARPTRRDLWTGVAVARVQAAAVSAQEANEFAKKLLALGYLSGGETKALAPTGGERPGMTEGAWNNLGLYERETVRDFSSARVAFEKALAISPGYHSAMFNLANLFRSTDDDTSAREWLFRSLDAGQPQPEQTLAGWVRWYQQNRPRAVVSLLEPAVKRYAANEFFARTLAEARFEGKDCAGGYALLAAFEPTTSDPDTLNSLALLETCRGDREKAIALFERSLSIKPDQPGTIQSLSYLKGNHGPKG